MITDDLRKLAEAATPGPWRLDKSRRVLGRAFDGSYRSICDQVRGGSPQTADANTALIAACSPERIIALLDERDQMQRVIDAAKAYRIHTKRRGDTADTDCQIADCLCHSPAYLDAALAALEQERK